MKNYVKLFTLLCVLSIAVSCNDDFLTENPTTFVTPSTLLVDEAGASTYLTGAYSAVQNSIAPSNDRRTWGISWGTLGTDEVVLPPWGGDRKLIYFHQLTPTTPIVNEVWENLYISLNRVNSVVDRIGAMSDEQIDVEVRNRMVAEAKFLRTTINFALVSTWENVPLQKNETTSLEGLDVSQAAPEEVYEFMIEDLKSAIPMLPTEQGAGRVTSGAASALLGKIYLQMTGFPLNQTDKFALAEEALANVITSGVYDLLPNYADVFDLIEEQNREIVFSIGMEGPGIQEGGILSTFYGPNGNVTNGGGWGTCFINHGFADSYDADDARLLNNIAKHNANNATPEEAVTDASVRTVGKNTWRGWKWHAESPNNYPNDTPFDAPYIRYADVLLMYAEALNGQNKLTQADVDNTVNRLRARARITPEAVPAMLVGSKEANSIALLDERRKELCLEGWRRNDLIRFGVYEEAIKVVDQPRPNSGDPTTEYESHEIRWPIPEPQRQLNDNLDQNPGY